MKQLFIIGVFLTALTGICYAMTVNIGNGIYLVSGDDNVARMVTKAELDQQIVEKQNALHNQQVSTQQAIASATADIAQAQAVIDAPAVNTTVDTTVY